jgi:hypothetical protein
MLTKLDVVPVSARRLGCLCSWRVGGLLSTVVVSDKSGNAAFTRLSFAITAGCGSSFPLGHLSLAAGRSRGGRGV